MAVSAIARGFQIFSGLGTVATTSLVTTFSKQTITNKGRDVRNVGEEVLLIEEEQQIPEKVTEEELKPKDVMEVVKKIVGKEGGKPICFWLPNQSWLELLMCVSEGKLNSPLLFHYDVWNSLRQGRKVKQVESISFSTSPATMRFTDGQFVYLTRTARLYLTTQSQLHKMRATLIPESQCRINENGKNNYQLTCSNSQNEIFSGKVALESLHKNKYQTLTNK